MAPLTKVVLVSAEQKSNRLTVRPGRDRRVTASAALHALAEMRDGLIRFDGQCARVEIALATASRAIGPEQLPLLDQVANGDVSQENWPATLWIVWKTAAQQMTFRALLSQPHLTSHLDYIILSPRGGPQNLAPRSLRTAYVGTGGHAHDLSFESPLYHVRSSLPCVRGQYCSDAFSTAPEQL